jgi:phosphoribosyl-AMP cyclohydrolase
MELKLNFEKGNGFLPAIAQDWETGQVLMMAFMNRESWEKTLATGKVHYWSRSRNALWLKGEISGHVQLVKELFVDCDGDTILLKVEQLGGGACHTGYKSCFYQKIKEDGTIEIYDEKAFDPEEVYKK